jgi:preprotein translocase subunit SecA
MRYIEKAVLLQTLDYLWREHLVTLDHLRQAVSLRGYAQRDPLHEYKSEAFQLFASLLGRLRQDVTGQLMHVVLAQGQEDEFGPMGELPEMQAHHLDPMTGEDEFAPSEAAPAPRSRQERRAAAKQGVAAGRKASPAASRRANARLDAKGGKAPGPQGRQGAAAVNPNDPESWGKVARNAPCPCGSGKKFKHCHGAIANAAAE